VANNFFVKNSLSLNNQFIANTSQIILNANIAISNSNYFVGNSTFNANISATQITVANTLSTLTLTPLAVTAAQYLGSGIQANASQYWSNAAGIVVTTGQLNNVGIYTTITDSASPVWDTANGINFNWTLGASRTLPNPTQFFEGRSGVIKVKQNGTGGFTLGFGTCFIFDSDVAPIIGTAANKSNFLFYHFVSSANVLITLAAKSVTF